MSACHTSLSPTTLPAFERLRALIVSRTGAGPHEDFEAFELEVHELVTAVERELIAQELARNDVDVPVVLIDGVPHSKVTTDFRSYMTRAGTVRVERSLYRADRGEPAKCPMELRVGIVEGWWTPAAARMAMWTVAHMPAHEAAELFKRLGGMAPSRSSLDAFPRRLNPHWEQDRARYEQHLTAEVKVPDAAVTMGVSLDGVMLPMKDVNRTELKEKARDEGKSGTGAIGCREASCGTVSFYDADGERVGQTLYLGRMPEPKKVSLKASLERAVVTLLALRPDLVCVGLADGAKDNWTYLSRILPASGEQVLDFYHASERLKKGFDAAYGKSSTESRSAHEHWKVVLRDAADGIRQVVGELIRLRRLHPERDVLRKVVAFFWRHRHRMKYAVFQRRNLPIGSGVVEAANKTLVTVRMKRAGARWRTPGGQGVLTFRALAKSNLYDRAWDCIISIYKAAVELPQNVIPIPRNRRA